jgi:cytochrome c oxidase assembly protein subunit 11
MEPVEAGNVARALTKEELAQKNKRLIIKLMFILLGSVLFAISLVPLYNVICTVTGLNGKTNDSSAVFEKTEVDQSRKVNIQFTTSVMSGLGWNFYPKQSSITVHPGQIESVTFIAKNTTSQPVAGKAVPSVTPGAGAASLKKIECFCFVNQTLQAGEEKEMPLRFYVSPDLSEDVKEMTLAYTFFPTEKE